MEEDKAISNTIQIPFVTVSQLEEAIKILQSGDALLATTEQFKELDTQVKGLAKAIGQLKDSLAKSVSDVATEQSSHYLSQSNQIAELQIRVQLLLSLVERVSKLESADTTWALAARLGNLESRIDAYNEHHKKFGYSGAI